MKSRRSMLALLVAGLLFVGLTATSAAAQTNFRGETQSVDWGPVQFTVEVHDSPATRLRVTGKIENTGYRTLRELRVPMCLAWIRIYSNEGQIWSNAEEEMCDALPRPITLAPGEVRTDTYSYNASEILSGNISSGSYRIAFHLPPMRWPGQPPRTQMEVNLGTITLEHPQETRPAELSKALTIPDLPWGSSLEQVKEKFEGEGFQHAKTGLQGSLYFNDHDFLGRNAGIIARPYRKQLVKLVAMMEPNDGESLGEALTHVRQKLEGIFGPPDKVRPGDSGHQEVFWRASSAEQERDAILHLHIYTDRSEPVVRADFQSPRWEEVAQDLAEFDG